ncbi:MAG: LLM class flavin-dependent oxidoreductase [Anaerolineae bacterium]|nr:LLM class flavin-dependent oxidoreductase [Phycisphaerae bacterium]
MIEIGITDHLEGPLARKSGDIFHEVADLVRLADQLGARYFWFAEHHDHTHEGHLPTPLLMALHLAGQTKQIQLGSAVICLNLHHPLDVAEQSAVADVLTNGRMAIGFGSGCKPEEAELFGVNDLPERERHDRYAEALEIITALVGGKEPPKFLRHFPVPLHRADALPKPADDFLSRCWCAVNSLGAARIAGRFNFNMLFSHLRTIEQYHQFIAAYRAEGGTRKIAANRPVFVGINHADARQTIEPTLRTMWRRFQAEGRMPANATEPTDFNELAGHPINFIVGGAQTVIRDIRRLHEQVPFDVLNIEVRWPGLTHEQVKESLTRFMTDVASALAP